MTFVLVLPLILAFLSSIQSDSMVTDKTSNLCYKMCPPGYHKAGHCDDPAMHKCKECEKNTFTAFENTLEECRRCDVCGHYEVVVKPCSITNDVSCQCKVGYYNALHDSGGLDCRSCNCKQCKEQNNSENKRKCPSCQRECLEEPTCRRKCATTIAPSTTASMTVDVTKSATVMSKSTGTNTSGGTSNPFVNQIQKNTIIWSYWLVVLIFMVIFGLLLLFTKNLLRHPDGRPCWSLNKEAGLHGENPKFTEQGSHQDGSPTTVTLNISEEFPMLPVTQSPSPTEHPAHNAPLLPNAEHDAPRQDEQSRHWPAIVLYTIIKEVPLRRWKEFLRLLSVADDQLERIELDAGFGTGSLEKQYQMLRLWSQHSSASLNDVFSALHYMNLSGCAQMLQESLEKLQWRHDVKQDFTACRNDTDHDFNAATQDT